MFFALNLTHIATILQIISHPGVPKFLISNAGTTNLFAGISSMLPNSLIDRILLLPLLCLD